VFCLPWWGSGVHRVCRCQHQHELAIRLAIGAAPGQLRRLVMHEGLQVSGFGLFVGLTLAWAAGGVLTSELYGVAPRDPSTFVLAASGLLLVSLAAMWLPARRATRIDPMALLGRE
jgi:putative ABC transport system permease protein